MGFVKKLVKPAFQVATGNIGGAIGSVVEGLGKGVGAAKQQEYNPYQYNKNAFNLSGQDAARSTGFINQIGSQVGGYDPLVDMLAAQSRGEGPSVAAMQLQDATDRNIAQQMGTAAGNRAINPALAARLASENIANLGQAASSDSAQLRAQEILDARNQELQARNAQAATTGMGGNMAMNFGENNRAANMDLERLRGGQAMGGAQVDTARFDANQNRIGNFASNLGAGLGSVSGGLKEKTDQIGMAFKNRKKKKTPYSGVVGMDS